MFQGEFVKALRVMRRVSGRRPSTTLADRRIESGDVFLADGGADTLEMECSSANCRCVREECAHPRETAPRPVRAPPEIKTFTRKPYILNTEHQTLDPQPYILNA